MVSIAWIKTEYPSDIQITIMLGIHEHKVNKVRTITKLYLEDLTLPLPGWQACGTRSSE
jgi:hypothetical protein